MDDFFSFDLNFKRICFAVMVGFFIIAFSCFVLWSICIYLPRLERIKEAKESNEFVKEFYAKKGLPVPGYINSEEF
ncbi:MAG: hypothetical protein D4Q79_00940 [Spirochaetia bacterium]|nr:MAG: hypothetical protein D4Q79_00940 [Spirochaetia bacterium]